MRARHERRREKWYEGRRDGTSCKLLLPALLKGLRRTRPGCAFTTNCLTTGARRCSCGNGVVVGRRRQGLRVVAAYLTVSRKDYPGAAKAAKVARTWYVY